ncbi:MAG: prolyl oligopeptidase family serine peptidase [Verrucomicrobiaceae bacterium]|nr:prolyl oligopeptidase family serine peptidase [Verrucomicrobiaceae bacterium]NCF92390.1 prolyl oligopeptidase family serine peptidase [Verrucomicrobiaceae bacterium]
MKRLLLLIYFAVGGTLAIADSKIQADIVYGHKHGLAMTMDLYQADAEPNGAAILFMMSGGWVSKWAPPEQIQPLFAPYLAMGFKVFCVRHGSSPRYSIPEAIADVRRAVRYVRSKSETFDVDPECLGVLGMSAGGHLALMLGTSGDDGDPGSKDPIKRASSRVAAVAALVPPTDLRVAVWEAPETLPAYKNFPALDLELREAGPNSPLTHVTSDDAPALVIMGGKDELVPPRHGEWIAKALEREKVPHKLIVFPDSGHGLEGNQGKMVSEVTRWFVKYLADSDK